MILKAGESAPYISLRGKKYIVKNEHGKIVCYCGGKKAAPTGEILKMFSAGTGPMHFDVYAAGSAHDPSSRCGAYGAVVMDADGISEEYSEGYQYTTWNRMELRAVIEGLRNVPPECSVDLYSASQYIVRTIQGTFHITKNLDLWHEFDVVSDRKAIHAHWVKDAKTDERILRARALADKAMHSGDLKQDRGYRYKGKYEDAGGSRQGNERTEAELMELDIEVPNDHEDIVESINTYATDHRISLDCARSMNRFQRTDPKDFGSFAALKTGGFDMYSGMPKDALIALAGEEDHLTAGQYLDDRGALAALRWHLRGLSLKDSIRKVLVDQEISARKAQKQHKEAKHGS